MNNIDTLGSNIKKLRLSRGLTQQQLADIVGATNYTTISKWESDSNSPRGKELIVLSRLFNVSVDDLLGISKKISAEKTHMYKYLPINVAAGKPESIESITNYEEIEIPDSIMGKWAGHSDIMIMRVNGESMNKTIPNGSLIAIKPTNLANIKNNDIVVFSNEHEYSVKRFLRNEDKIVFRPHSTDSNFTDYISDYENSNLKIYGKVVLYIVEMD